jgi:hypothetical protein
VSPADLNSISFGVFCLRILCSTSELYSIEQG